MRLAAQTTEAHMQRLTWLTILAGVCGCDGKAVPTKPDDPHIKAERRVEYPGGRVDTPVGGGGYNHGAKGQQYEGPYSKAPGWAKE